MRKVFKVGFLNDVDSYMKSKLKYGILEPRGRKKTLCAILSKFLSLNPSGRVCKKKNQQKKTKKKQKKETKKETSLVLSIFRIAFCLYLFCRI